MMKEYIIESFLLLLQENKYEQITIGEITVKAGVNRSTYYRHFNSKDDIICAYFENLLVDYMDNAFVPDLSALEDYLLPLFTIMYKNKKELMCIHKSGHSHLLLHVFNKYFITRNNNSSNLTTLQFYYHAGGIFNINQFWFDQDMNIPPKEMAKLAVNTFPKEYLPLVQRT
ncbi:MAG: TetR/AcrR family transcriptional regulator [bacterium]|nr:TetR/AcrR family transcriptional regulator [bacterium]